MGLGAVIGLDIGNTTIKVAEVRAGKAGAHVAALGIAPTPLDSVNQSMVIDAAALGTAIRELLASCGARARQVVSSVAGQQSLVVRIIEVPRMNEKELAETMKWEVERHVPFASSEMQKDYQVIHRPDAPADSQTMEVLLVVAQQAMISAHLEAVQGAGLEPVVIDVEPLAASRALVEARGAEYAGRTIALVNIGACNTDISIVRDGNLLFQRTIPSAGSSLTQAIASALNISTEEAERIKKLHAYVDLESFGSGAAPSDVFGEEGEVPFGFGAPVFDTAATPAAEEAASPTLFNPFGAVAETPAESEASALFNPFGTPEESATAASPFGAVEEPAAPAGPEASPTAANPFAPEPVAASPFGAADEGEGPAAPNPFALAPEPSEPAAASPFGGEPAGQEDAFDLSAFAAPEFGAATTPEAPATEGVTPRQVFEIIRDPLADLVTEVKRSLDYFRGRSSDSGVDLLILGGGTARLPNLDQLLSAELNVPVVLADPFQAVPVQTTQYPAEYVRQVAPMFAVSVGLGLRETVF